MINCVSNFIIATTAWWNVNSHCPETSGRWTTYNVTYDQIVHSQKTIDVTDGLGAAGLIV
jgi:hypothetical protein